MKISEIVEQLRFADRSAQVFCEISSEKLRSCIYIVGQVKENVPGFILGEREPHLRELTLGNVLSSISTFEQEFLANEFLLEIEHEINESSYELRYFQVTNILLNENKVLFQANENELQDLRELYENTEDEYE